MDTNSNKNLALNYGLILGIILILLSAVTYFSGMMLEGEQWPIFIYYLVFPIIVIYAIYTFKKNNGNSLSLTQGLKTGMGVAVISGLVYVIWSLILNYVIDPELIDKILTLTEQKLMENPNMTEESIKSTMDITKKMSNPLFGSAVFILMSAFFGFIYSLISSLIMKTPDAK